MSGVSFLPQAREEFLAAVEQYEEELPGLGMRFADTVEAAVVRVEEYPRIGHPCHASTRRILCRGFPFSLVYRFVEDGIVIVAVPHHSRKPDFWSSR